MKSIIIVSPEAEFSGEELALFERDGISARVVRSAEEALEAMNEIPVVLVVSELELPGISGDELCNRLKEKSDIYVIIACSGKRKELKVCGLCGADAYVQTPLRIEDLAQRVAATLRVPNKRATRVLVKVKINGSIKSEPFFGISKNMSVTGLMLEAEQSLAREDVITCSFYLPDSEKLSTDCRVVRVSKAEGPAQEYGIEFVDLPPEGRKAIEGFVQREREQGNFY